MKIFQLLKKSKKTKILKSQYIQIFEYWIFEVCIEIFVFSISEFYNFWSIEFRKCRNSYFRINLAEYKRSI